MMTNKVKVGVFEGTRSTQLDCVHQDHSDIQEVSSAPRMSATQQLGVAFGCTLVHDVSTPSTLTSYVIVFGSLPIISHCNGLRGFLSITSGVLDFGGRACSWILVRDVLTSLPAGKKRPWKYLFFGGSETQFGVMAE